MTCYHSPTPLHTLALQALQNLASMYLLLCSHYSLNCTFEPNYYSTNILPHIVLFPILLSPSEKSSILNQTISKSNSYFKNCLIFSRSNKCALSLLWFPTVFWIPTLHCLTLYYLFSSL